ncbi:hypothetical protein A0126_16775 (plasmid) [Exiguobacterium sp. N4-1P]|uniref:DUF2268 domain-containing protein n=1 Tax=Exiguobacterium sp. N4-1P TaxID=2051906 RepID=UPI000B587799|nr:DUF2268 domain-containing putative Zn-dependent protease [Exiguobacterium sp. N4-1P]ASI35230.1 hypothetical protein A0126_06500 [Exiguobacterium sp. N4-1P]ASI37243.1 hypothetical protein A0126_16775 [Exiguobacterium sp. N4-1P]
MKKILAPFLCVPLVVLTACSEESQSEKFKPESIKINHDSEVNIVPLYSPYQKYLKASLDGDTEVSKKNYMNYVLSDIDKIGEKEEFDTTSLKGFFMMQSTAYQQALLDRIEALEERQDEIKKIITKNYTAAHKVLPKKKSTIFIVPINSEYTTMTEPMGGVAAGTYKDAVVLYLDEDFDKDALAYTVAHEYHHLILQDRPEYQMNKLLDSVIIEGKADAFADRILKDVKAPWDEPMDETTIKHVSKLIQTGEATYEDLVGGSPQKDIPRWSNYNLGHDILDHYFKLHPDSKIEEWSFKGEADLLKGYKYKKLLQ